MVGIIIAAAIVGATGIIIGLFLGFSGEKLKVEVNEKELAVREMLPGNNCGGCGFPGCDGLAEAIANGNAPANGCPVCSDEQRSAISKIMGVDDVKTVKKVAYVKCKGDCNTAKNDYEYTGVNDCKAAALAPNGGSKSCNYGCLGFGSCAKICTHDAISIINGVAVVNQDLCGGCGQCVKECPKNIIELRPQKGVATVYCSSLEKGKPVIDACGVGCIGCTLCEKQCEEKAITMENNIPVIDYNKCTGCGKCAEKCPKKIISIS